ncbi:MAG: PEP-CTERM sorting domain-containing protein [Pirellulaceae bacterium]|nr:PEP-CTERM sorting domain-containing protein [Pirellulaceae bacterium]
MAGSRFFCGYVLSVMAFCWVSLSFNAKTSNADITSFMTPVTENFNTFDGTAAWLADRPQYSWSYTSFTPGGLYNGAGSYATNNSTYGLHFNDTSEIAFGAKRPSSTTNYFFNWTLTNLTGQSINSFRVAWDVEQYSQAGRATEISFNYNPNSTGFTTFGIVGDNLVTAVTGSPDSNLGSVLVTNRLVTINLAAPLLDGQSILFGWRFGQGAGAGANAHMGIDNLSVMAVPEPSVGFLGLLALTCIAGVSRRRR